MPRLDLAIIPFADWPARDQAAWHQARVDGGPFDDSGALAGYAPRRLHALQSAYGRWLGLLIECTVLAASGLEPCDDPIVVRAFRDRLTGAAPPPARTSLTHPFNATTT